MKNIESNNRSDNVDNQNMREKLEALNDTLSEQKEALESICLESYKMVRNFYNKTVQSNLSYKELDNLDKSYADLLKAIHYLEIILSNKNNTITEFTRKAYYQTTSELDYDSKADPLFTRW